MDVSNVEPRDVFVLAEPKRTPGSAVQEQHSTRYVCRPDEVTRLLQDRSE
jgi:hypothetical protein